MVYNVFNYSSFTFLLDNAEVPRNLSSYFGQRQQKIAAIALIAIGILATFFAIYQWYFRKQDESESSSPLTSHKITPLSPVNVEDNSPPLSPIPRPVVPSLLNPVKIELSEDQDQTKENLLPQKIEDLKEEDLEEMEDSLLEDSEQVPNLLIDAHSVQNHLLL